MSQKIYVDELDFDEIKKNLKAFLSGQDQFKDYNFEGSSLSVLLDLLSFNSHYNGLYANFIANEMFIDSASKYSSVVSLAKTIGYTPRSYRSAQAVINLTVTLPDGETPIVYIIPKGTSFVSPLGNVQYIFSTNTDYSAARDVYGNYNFTNVVLYEGKRTNRTYTKSAASEFVIPNLNADTTSLIVNVRESGVSSVVNTFTYSQDLLRIKNDDLVYFVKQREDQYYEVFFGNNIIGKSVENGNEVSLDFIVSSGSIGNGLTKFTYFSGNRADIFYDVTLVSESTGGDESESLNSIKFNAPKAYTAQNRACTVSDYETLIYNNFSNVQSVKIWGGQDNIPKKYGKVFICAKPFNREYLNIDEKTNILNILESRKIMTMIPTFVDPEILRVEFAVSVYYNQQISRRTDGELKTRVLSTIVEYNNTLNIFDASFRYSTISGLIDKSDTSIISNIINIRVRNPLNPAYNTVYSYLANYGNPINRKNGGGTFFSTKFYENNSAEKCFLIDDGNGIITLVSETDQGLVTKIRDVGTINYSTGMVSALNINVTGLHDQEFEFIFYPSSNDIIPVRQYITTIPTNLISVTIIPDAMAAGDNRANSNHIFTSSR